MMERPQVVSGRGSGGMYGCLCRKAVKTVRLHTQKPWDEVCTRTRSQIRAFPSSFCFSAHKTHTHTNVANKSLYTILQTIFPALAFPRRLVCLFFQNIFSSFENCIEVAKMRHVTVVSVARVWLGCLFLDFTISMHCDWKMVFSRMRGCKRQPPTHFA